MLAGTRRLEPCDVVVAFSDGLVERPGELIDVGLARLAEVVCGQLPAIRQRAPHLAVEDALEQAADAILDLMLPNGGRDDVALVLHAVGASST